MLKTLEIKKKHDRYNHERMEITKILEHKFFVAQQISPNEHLVRIGIGTQKSYDRIYLNKKEIKELRNYLNKILDK